MRLLDRAKQARSLSVLRQARILFSRKVHGKVLILRRTVLHMAPGARIRVDKGSLALGKKWFAADPTRTFVALGPSSTLSIGDDFAIYSGARITLAAGAELSFAGGGYANHNFSVDCSKRISIGMGTVIGPSVTLRDADNKSFSATDRGKIKEISIGRHVWIGSNVTILKGVTIGDGAVVAAGSVVTKSVPPHSLVAGVPAKVIREHVEWFDH